MGETSDIRVVKLDLRYLANLNAYRVGLFENNQQPTPNQLNSFSRTYSSILAAISNLGLQKEIKREASYDQYIGYGESYRIAGNDYEIYWTNKLEESAEEPYAQLAVMNYALKVYLKQPITHHDLFYLEQAAEHVSSLPAILLLNVHRKYGPVNLEDVIKANPGDFYEQFLLAFEKHHTQLDLSLCSLTGFADSLLNTNVSTSKEFGNPQHAQKIEQMKYNILNYIIDNKNIAELEKESYDTLKLISFNYRSTILLHLLLNTIKAETIKYLQLNNIEEATKNLWQAQKTYQVFLKFEAVNSQKYFATFNELEIYQKFVDNVYYMHNPESLKNIVRTGKPKDIRLSIEQVELYATIARLAATRLAAKPNSQPRLGPVKKLLDEYALTTGANPPFWNAFAGLESEDMYAYFGTEDGKELLSKIIKLAAFENLAECNFFAPALMFIPEKLGEMLENKGFKTWFWTQVERSVFVANKAKWSLVEVIFQYQAETALNILLNDPKRPAYYKKLRTLMLQNLPLSFALLTTKSKTIEPRLIEFVKTNKIQLNFPAFLRVIDKNLVGKLFVALADNFARPLVEKDILHDLQEYDDAIDTLYSSIKDKTDNFIYQDIKFLQAKCYENPRSYKKAAAIYNELISSGYTPATNENLSRTALGCEYYALGIFTFNTYGIKAAKDLIIDRSQLTLVKKILLLKIKNKKQNAEQSVLNNIIIRIDVGITMSNKSIAEVLFEEERGSLKYAVFFNTETGKKLILELATVYAANYKPSFFIVFSILRSSPPALSEFFVDGEPRPGFEAICNQILSQEQNPEQLKDQMLDFLFDNQAEYCLQVMRSVDDEIRNSPIYQALWGSLPEHIDKIWHLDNFAEFEPLIKQHVKLRFKYAVAKIPALDLVKLMPLFTQPERGGGIASLDNPIIVAARYENIELFKYAFENRENEPWKSYWLQAGDSECSLLVLMLKMKFSPAENDQMCEFVFNIPHVIQNLNYNLIKVRQKLDESATNETKVARIKIFDRLITTVLPYHSINEANFETAKERSLTAFALRALKYSEVAANNKNLTEFKDLTPEQMQKRLNAHKSDVAKAANEVLVKNFTEEFDRRYPEGNKIQKLQQADVDLRLLMLKQFIEDEPTIQNKEQHASWDKLLNLCGMQQYHAQRLADRTFCTFADFKQQILRTNLPPTVESHMVAELITDTNRNNPIDVLIRNEDLSGHSKLSWKSVEFTGRNDFDVQNVHNFTLFCMMLATENIDNLLSKVRNTHAAQDLFSLIRFSKATAADDLKDEVVTLIKTNARLQPEKLIDLKNRIKQCILIDQQIMQTTVVTEADSSVENASCGTGIFDRYTENVLNVHHKYSLFNSRFLQIGIIIKQKFQEYFDEQILQIFLQRLRGYNPHSRRASYILHTFNAAPTSMNTAIIIGNILHAANKPTVKFNDLKQIIKDKCAGDQVLLNEIMHILTGLPTNADLANYYPLSTDEKIKKLFDKTFSVTNDNWASLIVGEQSVPQYTDALEGKITFADLDARSKMLTECFGSMASHKNIPGLIRPRNIYDHVYAKLMDQDPIKCGRLTADDVQVIKYFCTFIAPAKELQQIAANTLDDIRALTNLVVTNFADLPDESSPQSNKYLINFYNMAMLDNPNFAMTKDLLRRAILFQVWQNTAKHNEEYDPTIIYDQIEDTMGIEKGQIDFALNFILQIDDLKKNIATSRGQPIASLFALLAEGKMPAETIQTQVALLNTLCQPRPHDAPSLRQKNKI